MYKALYRKYRPLTFSDVVGQEPITTTLKNQIVNDKLTHSYIFTGTRGTGKTSCAKILAKAVNCLNNNNGEPCLQCEICKGIDNGSIIDVVEMDAASNNKVDDIRFLRDELNYTPSKAKYRVYIIDEVHMLSISAFNALLKVMEEPPLYVVFILATTEIHKVPATILSRCQRYDFKRISVKDIQQKLITVAENEKINLTVNASKTIAILSDGGMRDALSILDLVSNNNCDIDENYVKKMCGVSSKESIFNLVNFILDLNVKDAVLTLNNMYMDGNQPKYILDEMLLVFKNILICNITNDYADIIACLDDEKNFYDNVKSKSDYTKMSKIINLTSNYIDKISFSSNKELDIEVFVIKLCVSNYDVKQENVTQKIVKQPIKNITKTVETPNLNKKVTECVLENEQHNALKIKEWEVILNELNKLNPAIASLLSDSSGYRRNEFILIDSNNNMLYSMLSKSAKAQNDIKTVVNSILGFTPRLGQYKKKQNVIAENKIDKIINDAKNSGIEYEEE